MSNITVGIRIRPQSDREKQLKKEVQWIVKENNEIRSVNDPNTCKFSFGNIFFEYQKNAANITLTLTRADHIFRPECLNYDVYSIVEPVVKKGTQGYNGFIVTYGQTSSGELYKRSVLSILSFS